MGIAARWPYDFLAFVQMYSICDLNVSFSFTIVPKIFFSLTCFITEAFTVISILELFLFLFSNRMTCVFCLFMFNLYLWHHSIIDPIGVLVLAVLCCPYFSISFSCSFSMDGLEGQLGSCKFDFAGSAEILPVKTRNRTGLSRTPEEVWNYFRTIH